MGRKGGEEVKRNTTLKPGFIICCDGKEIQATSEGILKALLNGVYFLKHLELG